MTDSECCIVCNNSVECVRLVVVVVLWLFDHLIMCCRIKTEN